MSRSPTPRVCTPPSCVSTSWCGPCASNARGTESRPTSASAVTCWKRRTRRWEALDARVGRDGEAQDLDRDLCEELGDLLYQVWFQAHLASERGAFGIVDVAEGVRDKLIARHPHVYGDVEAADADAVRANWDAIKLQEKGRDSVMDGISQTLPALLRAVKIQKRAAAAGPPHRRRPPCR